MNNLASNHVVAVEVSVIRGHYDLFAIRTEVRRVNGKLLQENTLDLGIIFPIDLRTTQPTQSFKILSKEETRTCQEVQWLDRSMVHTVIPIIQNAMFQTK